MLPRERDQFYAAAAARNGGALVVLSGDRHVGGLYRSGDVVDATASSWTHTNPCPSGDPLTVADDACDALEPVEKSNRLGPLVRANHFGTVDVDWGSRIANVALRRAATATGLGWLGSGPSPATQHLFAGALLQSVDVPL